MSAFTSLLSSLQDGKDVPKTGLQSAAVQPPARVITPKPKTSSTGADSSTNAAILKRKASQITDNEARKAPRLSSDGKAVPTAAQKPEIRKVIAPTTTKALSSTTKPSQTVVKRDSNLVKPGTATPHTSQPKPATTTAPAVKRGFASLMAKAQAASDAAKAVGTNTIKHKVTQPLTKKDRIKMAQEARSVQQQKHSKDTSRGSTTKLSSGVAQRPAKQELAYSGTMRAKSANDAPQKKKSQGMGQDKYGGYASWSDLDDAEDDEGEYDSSDMEEAGFDDVMEEEMQAARIARQEDQRELEAEERHKKEKLERKKRLQALSANAAAAKKRY